MHSAPIPHNISDRQLARIASVAEPDDVRFLAGQLAHIPSSYHPKLLNDYRQRKHCAGRRDANLWALDVTKLFTGRGLNYAADDSEIVEMAEQAARTVREKLPHCTSEEITLEIFGHIAARYDIQLPKLDTIRALIQRMSAEKWWRKQLRKRFQKVEAAAIQAGFVNRRAGLYASDETVNRRQQQKRKNAKLLENLEAVNDLTGEVCTLAELAATNTSNPAIRRTELMTRVRGLEEYSGHVGYIGLFITLTTPSRMHARHSGDGSANLKYDNTRPDKAQSYLCKKVWGLATSKLQRDGVDYFGVRVVEPHHDGTPHWHMLVFVKPEHQDHLIATLREYALRDSPDEPGAQDCRFNVKLIDPVKGSATGYLAKYVSKNIDGHAVGDDYEAATKTDSRETAERVEAWASLWRIRQFQFFGAPPVTPYRELRRLQSVPESLQDTLGEAWKAADEGDFCTYTRLHRDGLTLKPLWEERESATYHGEFNKRVRGVIVNGEFRITTREGEWLVREKESARQDRLSTPWTRVNNSTHKPVKGLACEQALTLSSEGNGIGGNQEGEEVERRGLPRFGARPAQNWRPE